MNEVAIIGSGPAGLTAAIYLARADLKPIVFMGLEYGGQLMNTTEIENFPGFPDGIDGPILMQNMIKQAERFGAQLVYETIDKVDFSKSEKVLVDHSGKSYSARSVIIATGANSAKLGIPGESEFWGKGVSCCATCDGAFYRGKTVAVIGGGDTAMEDSTFLTKFANKVYIIHRRDMFKASKAMQNEVFDNPKIEILWNTSALEVLGKEKVTGLKLKNSQTNTESKLEVDGMFLAIGHNPTTGYLNGAVKLDSRGYIEVTNNTKTNVDGVFVAGDVRDPRYKQAITAAGMGCMAALDCEKWIAGK
jgi:thioredoxin reductase (NADPH)